MSSIFAVLAWLMTFGAIFALYSYLHSGTKYLIKIHQIPCSRCQYFTDSCYLKCTVNPHIACSEEAIACRDFITQ
jgi:hypothetical protein